jgi:perosamine synthetase
MNIPLACPDLSGKESAYVLDAIGTEGRISSAGKYIDRFEAGLALRFERKFALSTTNGTTALHLALLGLGVGPGDEVIVPTFTFAASVATIVHTGARPVFVDVNPEDWTLDLAALDALRTPKTKVVVAVDIYGMPCDYARLGQWCVKHGVHLIEDAAEAHGATFGGRPVGSFGAVSCFSFFGNKILTTGEGGVCLSDNAEVHERMRVLKNHGMERPGRYEHAVAGYNYRMTNVQAAIGCAQLEQFDQFLAARHKVGELYVERLQSHSRISFQRSTTADQAPVCWLMSVLLDANPVEVAAYLKGEGIDTRLLFKPMHQQEAYRQFARGSFPVSEALHARGISLPSSSLLTEAEVDYVCAKLIAGLAKN